MSDSQKMNEITNGFSSDLPERWMWGKIGEIVEIKYGKGLIKENRKGGKFPVYGSNGIVGYHDQSLTQGQTIIIGRKGSVGEVHYSQIACYPIDTTYYIDNFVSVNSTYIFHLLRHSRLGELDKSTAIPGVNRDDIYSVTILIPPLSEQRFIVAKLESLLDHVKKAEESLEKIPLIMKRFRQAALKKAFSGELTTEWREQQQDLEPAEELLKRIRREQEGYYQKKVKREKQMTIPVNSENEPIDISDLPELPEGWLWTRIRDVNTFIGSGITPLGGKSNYPLTGIPFIRSQNVWPDGLRLDDIAFISEEQHEKMSRTKVHPLDILLNITGASIGRSTFVPEDFSEANVNQHVCIIRTSRNVDYRLISYFLNSPFGQDQIFSTQGGVTREGLNYKQVRSLKIPIAPLEEQREIVRRIESLFKFADETEKNTAEARKRVEIMTQSILARAFGGDLSADFREAVKNWKDLDAEARGRYIFVLPEEERGKVLNADEFPMERASRLLERIGEERGKIIKGVKSWKRIK